MSVRFVKRIARNLNFRSAGQIRAEEEPDAEESSSETEIIE